MELQFNAERVFEEFINDVNQNQIREDGSCKLFCIIDDYISQMKSSVKVGTKMYRARIVQNSQLVAENGFKVDEYDNVYGFNEANSREAPLGHSSSGRNNIEGISYLYLADRFETACAEVKPIVRDLISVAEFTVLKEANYIDFSKDTQFDRGESKRKKIALGILFSKIMGQYSYPAHSEAEYRATQVLTDHIRKTGIDGIAYRSFFERKGTNFTFFNSSRDRFGFEGSRVVMLQSERRTFLDINNQNVTKATTMGNSKYNADRSKELVRDIRIHLEKSK